MKTKNQANRPEAAEVERIAKLMHAEFCEFRKARGKMLPSFWDKLHANDKAAYRHVALALIRDSAKGEKNG